uniref:Uncharacterized protein n=1 Tax=Mycena chlorophos TaxID=658473 RepID=A0ABQ0L8K7_MYCCL|nr:predicted protein [Mycena chlorophos]
MDFTRSISNGDLNIELASASTAAIPRGVKRKRAAPKPAQQETAAQDAMDEDVITNLLSATRSSSPSPILANEFDDVFAFFRNNKIADILDRRWIGR